MTKISAVSTGIGGHNAFDAEVMPHISRSLLSLVHQEDKDGLKFGIVNKNLTLRPVVCVENSNSYIDLLTARVMKSNSEDMVLADDISYYDGCFVFKANSGESAFIDKEVLIKNYGLSIID